ncbi:cytochrome P450 [Salix suchowensis]|nr:cytochrome P450 [Salix suchowensis]
MMHQFFISILPFLLLLLVKKWLLDTPPKSKIRPPSPKTIPILGNLHQLGSRPHRKLHSLAKCYGPLMMLHFGSKPALMVSSADDAQEIMKTHDLIFSNKPKLSVSDKLLYQGKNISTAPYGEYWTQIRSICVLQLLSNKRVYSFQNVRTEETVILMNRIKNEMFATLANDIICRVALGRKHSEGKGGTRFKELLGEFMVLLGGLTVGEFIPWLRWLNHVNGFNARVDKVAKEFDRFLDGVIEEHMVSKTGGSVHGEDQHDFVDVLLVEILSLHLFRLKFCNADMFAAGTDTTFIILDWAMTELIMNPDAMEKAQDEVRGVVGDRKVVQESDLPRLSYMKGVIKEIFRLHPPSPVLLPRESLEDVIIDGYNIPAKTRIYVNVWGMGRDPELWGNPETFEPERFIGSGIDFKGQDFELIPFGAGRRSCPAITFGIAAIEIALAQLLLSFDWKLPPGLEAMDVDNTEAFGISMHRTVPLHVVAKPHFD